MVDQHGYCIATELFAEPLVGLDSGIFGGEHLLDAPVELQLAGGRPAEDEADGSSQEQPKSTSDETTRDCFQQIIGGGKERSECMRSLRLKGQRSMRLELSRSGFWHGGFWHGGLSHDGCSHD